MLQPRETRRNWSTNYNNNYYFRYFIIYCYGAAWNSVIINIHAGRPRNAIMHIAHIRRQFHGWIEQEQPSSMKLLQASIQFYYFASGPGPDAECVANRRTRPSFHLRTCCKLPKPHKRTDTYMERNFELFTMLRNILGQNMTSALLDIKCVCLCSPRICCSPSGPINFTWKP